MLEGFYNGKYFSICSGIILLSMIQFSAKICYKVGTHFCGVFWKSIAPRALVLASVYTSCWVLWESSKISSMGVVIIHYFSCSNTLSYYSLHTKLKSFHVSMCKGSAILLNPFINFRKEYTKPKNNCTYCTVVGFGYFLRLLILASLICSLSGEMSNPRKVVVHCRKLHFFSLQ